MSPSIEPTIHPSVQAAFQWHLGRSDASSGTVGLCNMAELCSAYAAWRVQFPQLLACCCLQAQPSAQLTAAMGDLGVLFRARCRQDLLAAAEAGVPASRILLDNPCKLKSLSAFAARQLVAMTTFDSEAELRRLAAAWPGARLLLMLRAPRCGATELGATTAQAADLLAAARNLGMDVCGVSLSMADSASFDAWMEALDCAKAAIDEGSRIGLNLQLLDLGSVGRVHREGPEFGYLQSTVMAAVNCQFAESGAPRLMCDPTGALLARAVVLATRVVDKAAEPSGYEYSIGDSVYSAFNARLLAGQRPTVAGLLRCDGSGFSDCGPAYKTRLIGQSDCPDDRIGVLALPELAIGDWILWCGIGNSFNRLSAELNDCNIEFYCCLTQLQNSDY